MMAKIIHILQNHMNSPYPSRILKCVDCKNDKNGEDVGRSARKSRRQAKMKWNPIAMMKEP